jgi:hypothetical protein
MIILFVKAYVDLSGMDENLWNTLTLHMLLSQISDRTGGKHHTLRSKQCKCGIFGGIYTPRLDMISFSSFYFETWLAYFLFNPSCACHLHFFYFFLFFWIPLEPSLCPYFFLYFGTFMCSILFQSFCIALLSLSRNMLERSYSTTWSTYFSGGGKHVIAYSEYRNSCLFVACTWVLILGAWNDSRQGSQNLTKLNTK